MENKWFVNFWEEDKIDVYAEWTETHQLRRVQSVLQFKIRKLNKKAIQMSRDGGHTDICYTVEFSRDSGEHRTHHIFEYIQYFSEILQEEIDPSFRILSTTGRTVYLGFAKLHDVMEFVEKWKPILELEQLRVLK